MNFQAGSKKYMGVFALSLIIMLFINSCTIQPIDPNMQTEDTDEQQASSEEEHAVHWSYEGETGPEYWGNLKPEYELCGTGVEQSPIDLTNPTMTDLENLVFDYAETTVNILNNGHTIQVNYDEGSTVQIEGQTYDLLQFHFHAPSDHTVDAAFYPLEMHLVHGDADGNLAVVGVFIREGEENEAFAPIWDNLPAEETEPIAMDATVNAIDLLPTDQVFFRYNGALTVPPCTEGVLWSVMASPVEMSAEQIAAFTAIFDNNHRPVQPLNERVLYMSETP